MTTPVMTATDEVCCECDRPIPVGTPYSERLIGVLGDGTPVVEAVCPVGLCRSWA